jgi:hypothetical protein
MFPICFLYYKASSWSIRFLQVLNISKLHHMLENNHSTIYVQSFLVSFPYKFFVLKCEPFFLCKICRKWLLSIAFQVRDEFRVQLCEALI